jgi:SAM-dependent methyltransferase
MDPHTLEFYEMHGKAWAASHPLLRQSPRLDAFLDRLPQGAAVLELGCGDGRDAERMIERGFDVHPSDGSPHMAALASARLGREVPVSEFGQLEVVEGYDAAWCQASLLHAAEDDLPGILARIHRALKSGGLLWASFKGGQGGGRDEFGRFFSYLPADRLEAAFRAAAPWTEFSLETREGSSYGGQPTEWHEVLARK